VRILRDGEPILYVAARPGFDIPPMEVDAAEANARFDREFALRRVPTAVTELPRTRAVNRRIATMLLQERGRESASAVVARATLEK
jgi:hypothetical protein